MIIVAQIVVGLIQTYIFNTNPVSERSQSKTNILDIFKSHPVANHLINL